MTFTISQDLYYSRNGEWIHVDENIVTVGLTDRCLHGLGEVLYLDLPEEGKRVTQDEAVFAIESAREIHDFISPVSGTILEVNFGLNDDPSALNDDPFEQGWIIRIEMDNEKDLANLMRASAYRESLDVLRKIPSATTHSILSETQNV